MAGRRNMSDTKREAILEAALKVFSEDGYHNSKVTKIAELAKVGAGTIYLDFKSKEDILEELFFSFWNSVTEKINYLLENKTNDAKEKFKIMTIALIDIVSEQTQIAKIILQEHQFWSSATTERLKELVERSRKGLNDIIQDGIDSKVFREDMSPDIAVSFYTGGMWHLLGQWTENKSNYNIDSLKQEAIKLILDGFTKR